MHAPRSSYDGPTATIRATRPQRPDWMVIAACVFGTAGFAVGVTVLVMLLITEGSVNTQLARLKHQIAGTSTQISKIRDADSSLSQQVGDLGNSVNSVLPLSRYTSICSQYLTGANGGPQTFYFPCSSQRP
jgi:hypothetical protein